MRSSDHLDTVWTLYHYSLCPFSRSVRLAMAEKGIRFQLVNEIPWENRDEFLDMNPNGETPVIRSLDHSVILCGSLPIIEYFEEITPDTPLMGAGPLERAETRRLIQWFDVKFYSEVLSLFLQELMWKRLMNKGSPSADNLRIAYKHLNQHLDYTDALLDHRRWLGGAGFSLADINTAAHISIIDYLGCTSWSGHPQTKAWYSAIKSRQMFRPFLQDRMAGIMPDPKYEFLDF